MPVINNAKEQNEADAKQITSTPAISAGMEKTIEELALVEATLEHLKERRKELSAIVLADTPKEPGEHVIVQGDWQVTLNIPEKWEWDKEFLEGKFSEGPLPDHIKRNYSVDKKRFENLSPEKQREILHALTIKPGTPKITIEKKV